MIYCTKYNHVPSQKNVDTAMAQEEIQLEIVHIVSKYRKKKTKISNFCIKIPHQTIANTAKG